MEKHLKKDSVSSVGSTDSGSSSGNERSMSEILEILRDWFKRFVIFQNERDLDILPLWVMHTWIAEELYSSPRLLIDSPMPGSGKTTLLEHMSKFCKDPVQMASVSSSALLGRLTANGTRTLLIDEADRALDPKKPGVGDLIALLNSGYKKGSTRPVLVQKNKEWVEVLMPTFSPVAIAGNSPNIPDDTRSRCIVVSLLSDIENRAQESDWEELDISAYQIRLDIMVSVEKFKEQVAYLKPTLPKECIGRFKEKWKPLKRVAVLGDGDWAQRVDRYILQDIENIKEQNENGDSRQTPHIQLAKDLYEIYEGERVFIGTATLVSKLARQNPEYWGETSVFGRAITVQKFGRFLNSKFYLNSQRIGDSPRGYHSNQFESIWKSLGLPPMKATEPTEPPKATEPESDNGEIW